MSGMKALGYQRYRYRLLQVSRTRGAYLSLSSLPTRKVIAWTYCLVIFHSGRPFSDRESVIADENVGAQVLDDDGVRPPLPVKREVLYDDASFHRCVWCLTLFLCKRVFAWQFPREKSFRMANLENSSWKLSCYICELRFLIIFRRKYLWKMAYIWLPSDGCYRDVSLQVRIYIVIHNLIYIMYIKPSRRSGKNIHIYITCIDFLWCTRWMIYSFSEPFCEENLLAFNSLTHLTSIWLVQLNCVMSGIILEIRVNFVRAGLTYNCFLKARMNALRIHSYIIPTNISTHGCLELFLYQAFVVQNVDSKSPSREGFCA